MKKALVLGGGGFIGGHLAKKLKKEGFWVRIADIKEKPDYFNIKDICDEYMQLDLSNKSEASLCMISPTQHSLNDKDNAFDEVYQLAADMGGAGYIFTEENDYNIITNSILINLNIVDLAIKFNVKNIFYSSSACIYPKENQLDPNNPNCKEDSAYPANPDSEYGWEKLFSERLYLTANKNKNLNIKIARYHNIYGPYSAFNNGKEKAPAAICRKVIENNKKIDIWGDGKQTRSFLYIDDAINATLLFMRQNNFKGPINIGSEEMVSINTMVDYVLEISNKKLIKNYISGPVGVAGRNSNNDLLYSIINWKKKYNLKEGLSKTYDWIESNILGA